MTNSEARKRHDEAKTEGERWATAYAWATEVSGMTDDEAREHADSLFPWQQ